MVTIPDDSILAKVADITKRERQSQYGSPLVNLLRTAILWTMRAQARGKSVTFTPVDVAEMMGLLKVARQFNKHKDDNLVDEIGYIVCIDELLREAQEDWNWSPGFVRSMTLPQMVALLEAIDRKKMAEKLVLDTEDDLL